MNSMTAYNIARDLCFVALKDKYQFAGRQVRTIAHETGTEVAEFVAHTPSANEADVRAYALIRSQLLGRHLESPDEKLARKLAEDAAKEAEVMA